MSALLTRRTLIRGGAGLVCAPAIIGTARAARGGFSASNYLGSSTAPVTAPPLSIAAWCYTSTVSSLQCAVSICGLADGSGVNNFDIGVAATGAARAYEGGSAGTSGTASASASFPTGSWGSILGVFTSSSARAVYSQGGNVGTNSTAVSAHTPTGVGIGVRRLSGTPLQPFGAGGTGLIGEVAVWNAARSGLEAAALASGVPAYWVAPSSLVWYLPLWGIASPEPDLSGHANSATITGSLSKADNPPITFYRGRRLGALHGDGLAAFLERKDRLSQAERLAEIERAAAFYRKVA
jgi:hypothetical protein